MYLLYYIFIFIFCLPLSVYSYSPAIEYLIFYPEIPGASSAGIAGVVIALPDNSLRFYPNPSSVLNSFEIAINFNTIARDEGAHSSTYPGLSSNSVYNNAINYAGIAYPVCIRNQNMVFSISYRYLYDFNRDWMILSHKEHFQNNSKHYIQTGGISALCFSSCFQLAPNFFTGISFNVSDNNISKNEWTQTYHYKNYFEDTLILDVNKRERYTFKGLSINWGFLWRINPNLSFGGIVVFPYTSDIQHKTTYTFKKTSMDESTEFYDSNESLYMPISYGAGLSYKWSDQLFFSMDVYHTRWDDFMYTDVNGNRKNPISGIPIHLSKTDPTWRLRSGIEYRHINKNKEYVIPFRAGFFYDPAPSTGCPDTILGLSLGLGLTYKHYSFDISYQYRFGNDIGKDLFSTFNYNFSQNLREHKIYTGIIFYLSEFYTKGKKK